MPLSQWSTSPGSNASAADNVNWAEGQAPSTVNNSSRQMMTDVADTFRNSLEWIDRNDSAAFSSGTKITFTGTDLTSIYSVNRRIRTTSSTPGILHGRITATAFSTNTTVTIAFDSTAVLSNESISDVVVGVIKNSTAEASLDAENIPRLNQFGIPVGTLLPFGSTASEPTGFAFCNGKALNRTTEADLFAVISTSFGSSSTSTFQTPDLRGRIIAGLDNLGGTSANRLTSTAADTLGGTLGQESTSQTVTLTGGVTSASLTAANLPSSVTLSDTGCGISDNAVSGGTFIAGVQSGANSRSITVGLGSGTAHAHADNFAVSSTGTVSVVQPTMVMPWIIKK